MAQSQATQESLGSIFASHSQVYDGPFERFVEAAKAKTAMRTRSHTVKKRRPCSKNESTVAFGDSIERIQMADPMLRGDRFLRNYSVDIYPKNLASSRIAIFT